MLINNTDNLALAIGQEILNYWTVAEILYGDSAVDPVDLLEVVVTAIGGYVYDAE